MANEALLALPLAVCIALSVALATYVGLRSRLRVRNLFVVLSLEVAFLAATYWLELTATTLEGKLFWNDLEYIVNVTVPPLFLIFTMTFLGRKVVTGRWRALLFLVPAVSLALVWTNPLHGWFYTSVWLEGSGYYVSFGHTYGAGFALHAAYSLALLLWSVTLLVYYYLRSSPMQRRQVRPVLVAAVIPIFALVVGLGLEGPVSLTYYFVVGFTAGGLLIFVGTFMYELFDVVPLAMEKILETVEDGIIVASTGGRVIFANRTVVDRAANGGDLYSRPVKSISPALTQESIERAGRGERVELTLGRGEKRTYSMKATPIVDREGTTTSILLTLRDITEEKQISESLKDANVKLNLLSSITRHDILNQVTVIRGAGELLTELPVGPEQAKRFGLLITQAAEAIERQFTFARDYQSLGVRAPEWQVARKVFERAWGLGLAAGLRAEVELDDVEVLADPLIERVFSVLLDNTRRHGERATTVRVTHRTDDGALVLTYEDDGVGIPPHDKERIFDRGFGRSGGLGLFLAREILDVNGASIRETGRYGEGARFEITFPPGRWRVGAAAEGRGQRAA